VKKGAILSLCGMLVAVCAQGPAISSGPGGSQAVPIAVAASRYGAVQLRTTPGALCSLLVKVGSGTFGDAPPTLTAATAGADGSVMWSYAAPLVPPGHGQHTVVCTSGSGSSEVVSEFEIAARKLDARGFTVRVEAVDPTRGLPAVNTKLDPTLVPARDAAVARIAATLENEWKLATRGLGALTLVPSSADIVVYVLPGKGTSVHVTAADGTQRVVTYVVGDVGPVSAENGVAVVLHELGHIWCCGGPDAGSDGHWLEKVPDPLLQGVDRFGLMTHPVTCLVGRGFESCPNRFSERELRTMGFTEIPVPAPDPCVTQQSTLNARLATQRSTVDGQKAQLATIDGRIKAIVAQYPSRQLPPDVYATYVDLVAQYNRLAAQIDANVLAYNTTIDQLNALPC
jgi:hypothetical protein